MSAGGEQAVVQVPVSIHSDARGVVFEPFDTRMLAAMQNCHVVHNHPGCVRGNHRHLLAHEYLVVSGPALVRFGEPDRWQDVSLAEGELTRFEFPAGVAHAVLNTSEKVQLLVAGSTLSHDPDNPDTEFVELIAPR